MTQRRLHVIHVLAARGEREARQFLFYPHPKWSSPDSGKPFLALPTKKIVTAPGATTASSAALRHTLAAVLREDLGLTGARPAWERRLPRATLDLCSPTHCVPTTYAVWPVVVPLDPARHDAPRARLGGEWLTEREALDHPQLSPTARRLLVRGNRLSYQPGAADDWTRRLLAARAGDLAVFGPLIEEMRPWLVARLRAASCTRPLFSRDEVEDALQDATIKALTYLQRFDPARGSAGTWLWTLSRNAAASLLRRHGVRGGAGLAEDVADDSGDPALLSQEREELQVAGRRIEQALDLCGPGVRRAWELRHVRERKYSEIAAEMGEAVGTIATWIHRVKRVARGLADREEGRESP